MAQRDIIVVGASAGGLQALTTIVGRLPPKLPACVFVVIHTRAESDGALPQILARSGRLPVSFAEDRDQLRHGHIYVAKPDFQLILTARDVRVVHGPRENGFRPAIDPLFRTAARVFGPRVVGVILSGALDDGTYGLSLIKQCGGVAIVQDPQEAIISAMPRSAMEHVEIDHILPASDIAAIIERLCTESVEGDDDMAGSRELEPQLPAENTEVRAMEELYGSPSALTCPDCGGALWEIQEGRVVRYQCHVGHQFAPDSLEAEQRDAVDGALWSAVRVLEEQAELKLRMARRAAEGGLRTVSQGFEDGARDAHDQAQRIRDVLFTPGNGGNGADTETAAVANARDSRAPRRRKGQGTSLKRARRITQKKRQF